MLRLMSMAARFAGALALGCGLGLGADAGAAESWLSLDGGAGCSVDREALALRVLDGLVGERAPGLSVFVSLTARRGSVAASVRVARGSRELGQTRLVAPSCDEAIDAVVAVAALAVGAAPALGPAPVSTSSSSTPEPSPPEPSLAAPSLAAPPRAEADRDVASQPRVEDTRFHLLLAAGADQGVLSSTTAIVGAGAALDHGEHAEWRALLWYGLPSSDEQDDTGVGLASRRSDFAAASLDYCRRLTAAGWWSLCGGLEARVARLSRVEDTPDLARIEREQLAPSGAARAGLALVQRELAWQPRLELGAQVPVVGTSADAGWLGFRASFGAALPF